MSQSLGLGQTSNQNWPPMRDNTRVEHSRDQLLVFLNSNSSKKVRYMS